MNRLLFSALFALALPLLLLCACTQQTTPPAEDDVTTDGETESPWEHPAPSGYISILNFDVPNDGSKKDVSLLIQSALEEHKTIFLPAGTYQLRNPIKLSSGARLLGEEGTEILVTGGKAAFNISSPLGDGKLPEFAGDIQISTLTVRAEGQNGNYAVSVKGVRALTVEKLTVEGMGGVSIGTPYSVNVWDGSKNPVANAGIKSDDSLSTDITIKDCVIDCKSMKDGGVSGIVVAFANGFRVENCKVKNAFQGIQFWGGDSDYNRGGRYDYLGMCKNGEIIGCEAHEIWGGGIWGSMGTDITVRDSVVSHCLDVGIDFEGCHNATASGNKVTDCKNGNYATFQECNGKIVFEKNTSVLSGEWGTVHYFNSNATQIPSKQDVIFRENTFTSDVLTSVEARPGLNRFTFEGNVCKNVRVTTEYNNVCHVDVSNNTMSFTVRLRGGEHPVSVSTVNVTSSEREIRVSGNKITSASPQGSLFAIRISYTMAYHDAIAECNDNTVSGFGGGITLSASPKYMRITVKNNTVPSIIKSGSVQITASGNKTPDGENIKL